MIGQRMIHKSLRPVFGLVIAAAVFAAACTLGTDREAGWHNFQTAVAHAPQDGYTVYWLGREFQAGGLTFTGPDVADFGTEVSGGGLEMSYNTSRGGLNLTLYSPAAWQTRTESVRTPANAIRKQVVVLGTTASLFVIPGGAGTDRPVNELQLNVNLGGTWVRALAGSGGPITPGGPDTNPLVDEQTFLNVLQNLRPYLQ
jgi:hypothetical protein